MGKNPAPMVADFQSQIEAGLIHVATNDDNRLVGFAVLFRKEDCMFLENVAVFPNQQGKGIGAALMEHFETKARQQGLTLLELYTNEKMTENMALYAHLGFSVSERRQEDGFNRIYFRKTIAASEV